VSQTSAALETTDTADADDVLRELTHWWNRHDLAGVMALYHADYRGTDVGFSGEQSGPEVVAESFACYWGAFPDLRLTLDDRIVAGNRVAIAWTARGTHAGTFMHIPPTGRTVTVRGVSFLTLDGGRISRATHVWDVAGLLRAVRLLPDL
jgi:steroid delta-isomerase-like uncharacterized protein